MGKDSPSPPPAPNYAAAAQTQGDANIQSAIVSNLLNRPTENTPYGSRSWTQSGTVGVPSVGGQAGFDLPTWTSNINLTPEGQKLSDQQMRISSRYGDIGESGLNRIQAAFDAPLDEQGIQQLQDKAYGAMTSRLDPQWNTREQQVQTQLTNQGLRPGSEAWDNAMRDFNVGRNDAYQQATLGAAQLAPSLLQQELAIRNQPLTEVNALRTGSQPNVPQFQPFATANAAPGNFQGAAQAQGAYDQGLYNSQTAQNNSTMSGLFSLGGSVLPYLL